MYVIEGDNAELMVMVVDPKTDDLQMHGAGGHSNAVITVKQAKRLLAAAEKEHKLAWLFVVWPANADGEVQVEQRELEDLGIDE